MDQPTGDATLTGPAPGDLDAVEGTRGVLRRHSRQ